jgi:RNA polymerase sigma-70 factor (ECF subfamily)
MPIILDVNPAYAEWKSSVGRAKEWALQVLIQRLERYAKAICWQRLPDHKDDFDQLANGIVWRALDKAEGFRGESQFATWFYRIAINECNRYLRNYKQRLETSLEEEMVVEPKGLDARLDLIALLNDLHGDDHKLLRLVAEGQDFNTISEALGVSRNAAIVRWSRLKERLRDAAI